MKAKRINAQWHLRNRMSENPTLNERLAWHTEHAKNCFCRPAEGTKMIEELQKRKLDEIIRKSKGLNH